MIGPPFMMTPQTPEESHNLVKQELGSIWDDEGWTTKVSFQ